MGIGSMTTTQRGGAWGQRARRGALGVIAVTLLALAVAAVACGVTSRTYRCHVTGIVRPCDMMSLPDMWIEQEETSPYWACFAIESDLLEMGALKETLRCDPSTCIDVTAGGAPKPTPQAMPPSGGDSLPASSAFCCDATCSSVPACPSAPAMDPCQVCAAESCCVAWSACQADENCQCWIACVAATGSASVCAQDPGTDPNGAVTCGPKDGTTGPLDGCLLTSCVAACGVTPPAPPPAPGEGAAGDATTLLGGLR